MRLLTLHMACFGLISLSLGACADAPMEGDSSRDESEIVGGQTIQISDTPWQVMLQGGEGLCGGSIVGEEWVLTAAHCFGNYDVLWPGNILVTAGTSYRSADHPDRRKEPAQLVGVAKIIPHPGFVRSTGVNDVALLHLTSPLVLDGTTTKAIAIASEANAAAGLTDPGVMASVSGWGNTSFHGRAPSNQLQRVSVPIVSNELAKLAYPDATITGDQLAAGYEAGGKGPCMGDSGGPLTVPNAAGDGVLLAGVVSWGGGCAAANTPGIYSRVSSFTSWFEDYLLAPVAAFSVTPDRLNMLSVAVTSEASAKDGSVVSTEWDFGDGATASGPTASHTYATDGRYAIRLKVSDNHGRSGSTSTAVLVFAGDGAGTALESGVTGPFLQVDGGQPVRYTIDVPKNAASLTVGVTGNNSGADLYVSQGIAPTFGEWDYRVRAPGTVTIDKPAAGPYRILLFANQRFGPYANVRVTATVK